MEDLYSIHPGIYRSFNSSDDVSEISDPSDVIKSYISTHPKYPKLVSAYIQCRMVGATSEMAIKLEEVGKEFKHTKHLEIGVDPELDVFMDSYCELLQRYKEDLSKPFDEAASFLNSVEMQLRNLSVECTASSTNDECIGSSEEELSYPDVFSTSDSAELESSSQVLEDQKLREMLLKKYSGYLTGLRKEFLKKKKKGKLPKDARFLLLDWWNTHYRWPYPTEDEKVKLAEITGLDQKQINNWFINQRKRHWKPSEEMQLALMEGVSAGSSLGTTLYFDTGTIGPGTT